MVKYIIKRLFIAIFILFGISLMLYFLMRMMPDNFIQIKFAEQIQKEGMSEADVKRLLDLYGLSDSIIVGYFRWLGGVFTGDFGFSFLYMRPVSEIISEHMWLSFTLALLSFIIYFVLAIYLGTRAAVKQYSIFDYSTTALTILGISLPSFFFSGLAIKVLAVDLGLFDASLGLISPDLPIDSSAWAIFWNQAWHITLPVLVMVILSIGSLMRFTRTNTLEVLNADYIRTARAKGLSEKKVIYVHAFKNTMIPLATIMAGILPGLFGGSMIIEQVFGLPGIGNIAYIALTKSDIPFVMGYNMFLAILTVIGVLLSDIMYVIVDPRVKLGK